MIRFSKSKEVLRHVNGEAIIDYHHDIMLYNVECGSIVYNVTPYGVFLKDLNVVNKFRRKGIATYAINLLKNSFNDKLFIGGATPPDSEAISFWTSLGADFSSDIKSLLVRKSEEVPFYIPTRKASYFI